MAKVVPSFDYSLCKKCGHCAKWCPMKALTLTRADPADPAHPFPEKTGAACLGCGQCSKECPNGAITMVRFGG